MNDYPKSKDLHQGSNHKPPPSHTQKPKINSKTANPPNTTRFGEMVPTNFLWLSPDQQRKRAKELEDIANKTE
jgi:hypothetical protein